jgi:arylformamidase
VIIPLSYPFTTKTPLYPNTPAPVIHLLRSMERGDRANSSSITFSTHSGTHIDAPRHFCSEGKTIADCLTGKISFSPVYCIDIPKKESQEINITDLEEITSHIKDAESLLIRTGWHTMRTENPERYSSDHPWVSPGVPEFLRNQFPALRLFGLDQISVSSPLHREAGHECHRKFLCGKKPILLLEDLNLSDMQIKEAFHMHIFPHYIDNIDGVPVTVIAEIR